MTKEVLSMNIKKIIPWSSGLAIYLTKEAKLAGWDNKDYVTVTLNKENEEYSIEIKRVPVKKK